MLKRASKKAVSPYTALAEIYDDVMEHVDYDRWAVYVDRIIQFFDVKVDWIVDISCGTGSCCVVLRKLGYRTVCADASLPMLKQAKLKAESNAHDMQFYCADMRRQPLHRQPDAVISLYDSMNYLLQDQDWRDCLVDIYYLLKSGGLFIFDVSTLQNSLREFSRYRQKDKVSGGAYSRVSSFDGANNVQKNYFEIALKSQPGIVYCETHRQVIRPLYEIISFVRETPFKLLAGYKDFTFKPFTEKSERVHFVLQKP